MTDQNEQKGPPEQQQEDFFLGLKEDPWGLSALYNEEKGVWFVPWMSEAAYPGWGVVSQELNQEFLESLHLEKRDAAEKKTMIAIVDTGVLKDHPLLKGHIIDAVDFTGEGTEDQKGHGTFMAILYLFERPHDQFISIKVQSKRGASESEQVESFVKGIRYAIDKQINLLSISVGWPVHCKDVPGAELLCSTIKEAIEQHNMILTVAGEALCPAECHPLIIVTGQISNGHELSFMPPTVTTVANVAGTGRQLLPYEEWKQRMAVLKSTLTTPQTAPDWIFRGHALQGHSRGDLEGLKKAAQCYSEAFSLDPRAISPEGVPNRVFSNLYATYYGKLPPEDLRPSMLACFDKALELDSKSAQMWRSKGFVLSCLQMHSDAIKCYDKAVALDERDGLAWFDKGVSLAALGKSDDAISCYDKALELDPTNTNAWLNKGAELFNGGKYRQAIECFDRALKINPEMVLAWYNKGEALLMLDERDAAMVCYNKALEINPQFVPALQRVGTTAWIY